MFEGLGGGIWVGVGNVYQYFFSWSPFLCEEVLIGWLLLDNSRLRKWSTWRLVANSGEKAPGTHWIGEWATKRIRSLSRSHTGRWLHSPQPGPSDFLLEPSGRFSSGPFLLCRHFLKHPFTHTVTKPSHNPRNHIRQYSRMRKPARAASAIILCVVSWHGAC